MKMYLKALIVACTLGLLLLSSTTSFAQASRSSNSFGIGLGAATGASGLSFKTSTSSGFSFQGVVGTWRGWGGDWHFRADSIAVAGDFLYEMPPLASGSVLSLGWNYGLGLGLGLSDNGFAIIGGTGVLGLEFNFKPAPIDFVVEYRPGLYIGGGDDFDIDPVNATGHLRFWF
jgi:hypothetical protein